MQLVKVGSKGDLVKLVQLMLNENGYNCGTADGIFGTNTEKAVEKYQRAKGLSVDGIVGNNTYAKLFADSLLKNGNRGELVKQCQTMLNQKGYSPGGADGIFGSSQGIARCSGFDGRWKSRQKHMDGIGRNRRYLGICIGSYECAL